jgi:hypothetical protein
MKLFKLPSTSHLVFWGFSHQHKSVIGHLVVNVVFFLPVCGQIDEIRPYVVNYPHAQLHHMCTRSSQFSGGWWGGDYLVKHVQSIQSIVVGECWDMTRPAGTVILGLKNICRLLVLTRKIMCFYTGLLFISVPK